MLEWLSGWNHKRGLVSYKEIKQAHVELSSYCNSWCPTCPRNFDGGVMLPDFAANSLSVNDFRQIFESKLLKRMTAINFCGDYGDPGMCKDLVEILNYIADNNTSIEITVHTNGGMRTPEFWAKVARVNSRFSNMKVVFSIDGLEDTNEIYRIGVKWNKLIENVKAFIAAGGNAEWDFLVFKYNQHQVEEAKQLSEHMGFTRFNQGNPHGFKYNDKIRVIDRQGKFKRLLERNTIMPQPPNDNPNLFDDIEYDLPANDVKEHFINVYRSSTDATYEFFDLTHKRLAEFDSVEIKECMCKDLKEIYVDANGGIHPCCFLGHVSQKYQQIPEMALHREWIEKTIGMDNINALKRPLKDIINSDYFYLIENSWSKTFAEGRNPVCVLKCGIQRPNNQIKR